MCVCVCLGEGRGGITHDFGTSSRRRWRDAELPRARAPFASPRWFGVFVRRVCEEHAGQAAAAATATCVSEFALIDAVRVRALLPALFS